VRERWHAGGTQETAPVARWWCLAPAAADNYGKSRAQVLGSGGRVGKGVTSEARSLDGADDSGRKQAHHARSGGRSR
jgi:hypothetical protein